jgi:hypothetical protein
MHPQPRPQSYRVGTKPNIFSHTRPDPFYQLEGASAGGFVLVTTVPQNNDGGSIKSFVANVVIAAVKGGRAQNFKSILKGHLPHRTHIIYSILKLNRTEPSTWRCALCATSSTNSVLL